MANIADFAQIAALTGDPARAGMLFGLMDGRALTAGELARLAGISPQAASGHLRQMEDVGLLAVSPQGRHRFYRLAGSDVAHMIEAITEVASSPTVPRRTVFTGPKERALRYARICYDHMAGEIGVGLADALANSGAIELSPDAAILTADGLAILDQARIATDLLRQRMERRSGRVLCRACLDWSERRPHVAGLLGAVLLQHSLKAGWVRQQRGTRALIVTQAGHLAFRERFGLRLQAPRRAG